MPVTENMRIFIERARDQRAHEFWNSSKKYQNFCDSPTTSPATPTSPTTSPPSSPISPPTSPRTHQPPVPSYEKGQVISYTMGRGTTKRTVVARVVSVSTSGKSIRAEDGAIQQGMFLPSNIRNTTTNDRLLTTRKITKMNLEQHSPIHCQCRVWNRGFGKQCSFKPTRGAIYCSRHTMNHSGLGDITQTRPIKAEQRQSAETGFKFGTTLKWKN